MLNDKRSQAAALMDKALGAKSDEDRARQRLLAQPVFGGLTSQDLIAPGAGAAGLENLSKLAFESDGLRISLAWLCLKSGLDEWISFCPGFAGYLGSAGLRGPDFRAMGIELPETRVIADEFWRVMGSSAVAQEIQAAARAGRKFAASQAPGFEGGFSLSKALGALLGEAQPQAAKAPCDEAWLALASDAGSGLGGAGGKGFPGIFAAQSGSAGDLPALAERAYWAMALRGWIASEVPGFGERIRSLCLDWAGDHMWRSGNLCKAVWVCSYILEGDAGIEEAAYAQCAKAPGGSVAARLAEYCAVSGKAAAGKASETGALRL